MKLLLARHGQTQANAEHRYLGALDLPLNQRGVEQAHELSQLLNERVDVIYSSPLLRARKTAEIVAGYLGLPVHIAPAFRERHVGVFEGLTQKQAQEQFPALWSQNITRHWLAAPDGGESISAVFDRVSQGLANLVRAHSGQAVLLIAHGFVAKVVRALVLGSTSDFFEWQLENAALLPLKISQKSLLQQNWISLKELPAIVP
jgi:probable phosphoglycerate mutase